MNNNKPEFDPNKPHQIVGQDNKPSFDPNKPFEEANSQQEEVGIIEPFIRGGLQGLSGGFSDEAVAGLNAAGKTLTEDAIPNKSPLEHLLDNYHKAKSTEEAREKYVADQSPGLYYGSEIAGSFVPGSAAFKAAKGASMLGRIATGAGLGALSSYGKSGQDEKPEDVAQNAGVSAALGGVSVPIAEKIAAPLLSKGINKVGSWLQDSPSAKQLAAATLNAGKGGTVFGEAGPQNINIQNEELAKNTANAITKGVSEKNQDFTTAFENAAQNGRTLETPDTNASKNLGDFYQDLENGRIRLDPEHAQNLKSLNQGALPPNKANSTIQYLKQLKGENFDNPNIKNSTQNLIDDLENGANKTLDGETIQRLNTGKRTAWEQVEPFIQKANDVIPDKAFQSKSASDLSTPQMNSRIRSLIKSLTSKAGNSTTVGTEAQGKIQELQQLLKDTGMSVNFPGVNPSEIGSNIQNQAYLNAAQQANQGVRYDTNLGLSKVGVFQQIKDKGLLFGAEKLGKNSQVAQNIAGRILSRDPIAMREAAQALSQNPKTAKLAEELIKASELNNSQKITNTTFQIMQNPEAKAILGLDNKNNSQEENK